MNIQAERDLLKDDYGNYYIVSNVSGDTLTIVNAALYYAFNQTIDEEFVVMAEELYANEVACGKFFADQVMEHIKELENPDSSGGIYSIEEVKKHFDLHVKPIYEDSFHM